MQKNKQFKLLILASLTLVFVAGCVTKPIVNSVNKPTTNQIEVKNIQKKNNISSTNNINKIDISDWQIYRNEEYNYTLKYPKNWQYKEVSYFDKNLNMDIKYVSFTDNGYSLFFTLNRIDESVSNGRTGIGAGDFITYKTIKLSGINIELKNLIYDNKVKEIFFNGKNDKYNIYGHFSLLGDSYKDDFIFDENKRDMVENIINSLSID